MRTYDIINAGPRNRFLAGGRIVSNSGRIFQPQNLPRVPDWFDREVQENVAEAMKADCEDIIWSNVPDLCAYSVRGALVAEPGKKFVVADLSNIEGRVLVWGAQEEWKLDAFKAYDAGTGHDLYKLTAGRILGKDPGDITKSERQNQGKVPELAGGFGGGVGAYRKMGGPVFNAMSDEDIKVIVYAWRGAHPRTKAFWYDMERAFVRAIEYPGESFSVRDMATFDVKEDDFGISWLRMRLPSGRYLCYPRPEVDKDECETCHGAGTILVGGSEPDTTAKSALCYECNGAGRTGSGVITYEGTNQYTRKWERLETYYGKIVENWVQAVARDVFMAGFVRAVEAGYPVVLRVHDELVCEVPDEPAYSAEHLSNLMATLPSWAAGLPLAAAGHECYRYGKE